ncbi:MAG: peptidylprolyl isomerase [Thermoleophilia bacterium]|nr:peptidylprolyl isomerase [Thermoleophilia bacterium]
MRRLAPVLSALALAGCGGGDDEAEPTTATGGAGEGGCRETTEPQPKPEGTLQAPDELLDAATEHRVVVETSCGSFTIVLDPAGAPRAAASFAALAEDGFYDGTVFHRIVPGFVIQGGDPTGTGFGGPGYTTVDPPAGGTTYPRGAVAMAKAGPDPAGTAGSQFFVVTRDAGLPPDYAVIGRVTEGIEAVDRIEALGDATTELPTRPVVVDRMTYEPGK